MGDLVLLTRPFAQSQSIAAELPLRFRPLISPLLHIREVPASIDLNGVDALLFTSVNGVECFIAKNDNRTIPAFCVGEKTTAIAQAAGLNAFSAGGTVNDLAQLVIGQLGSGDTTCLHIRGQHSVGDLHKILSGAGITCRSTILYEAEHTSLTEAAHSALRAGDIIGVPIFSPRTGRRLVHQARSDWQLETTHAIAISHAAAEPLYGLPFAKIHVATRPKRSAILSALSAIT